MLLTHNVDSWQLTERGGVSRDAWGEKVFASLTTEQNLAAYRQTSCFCNLHSQFPWWRQLITDSEVLCYCVSVKIDVSQSF